MQTFLDATETSDIDTALPKDGEALIILGRDGTARLITLGMSPAATLEKLRKGEALSSDEELDMVLAGKAFALLMAASNEQIMSILEDVASNPDIIDPDKLAQLAQVH